MAMTALSIQGFWGGLLALAIMSAATILPVPARAADIGLPNIVLVHGAFADGSSWSEVIPRLQAQGYHVTAVQIPLTSLADDVAATRRTLERQTGNVLLVGHSWAGAVVTEAGDAPNVKGLLYLSALVPDAGESVADMLQKRNAPMDGLTPDNNGFVWLDEPTAYAHVMAADVPPARVAQLAAIGKPIAASVFGDKLSDAAWTSRPSWYLVTEGDNALPTAVQAWLSQHIGATTKTIASSHMSMISHPDVVADFIAEAARKAGK